MTDFSGPLPVPGNLDVEWHAGWPSAKHDPAPEIQVHAYDEHTLILRQNKSVHFEAPFLFLLFGGERALLLDTGATADERYFPLRRTVDAAIAEWLENHPRPRYELLVAHTHGHGDHIAADGQFAGRPATTVVGPGLAEVTAFFGLAGWPDTAGELDLGGRVLDVIPGPGHEEAAVVLYDRSTGLLLTGDSFYPGMIYVRDTAAFTATVDRLLAFCATRPVTHILGCHIEMSGTPGDAYPRGTTYQPDEPPLQMTVGQLAALRRALTETDGRPGVHPFDDFIVDSTV
ncbi:MBL fold metallo-hydrolase [Streptomyces sp. H10-C2]|uniref:MBL fold metallo-hydrolase n=1 Tax=unclassified Streptomyces TaxID=2593676 RepID=UPI0024B9ED1C|nr:MULTISPECIES: MBL fold metallo-hydrolase [unclassified Streptomyces]MDJ0343012.1 MBL fold metallo-hydrolase [Streptomyces sp. PH10-H1]MDJ0371428.1 MBL fold metallo-hydrolase [Streptomyces sp. H10-C2]